MGNKRGGSKKNAATRSETTAQTSSPSKYKTKRKNSWDWRLIIRTWPRIVIVLVLLLLGYFGYQKWSEKESKGKVGESPPVQVSFNFTGHALFVFGDSTVDAGNFGFTAHPYGIDYKGMTPRFTNGRTIADYLAIKMGTQIPKAYNSLGPDELKDDTVNINFAAGGCGLLTNTMPIPCATMFDQVIQMVMARPGNSERQRAVYFVSAGANDFVFNFNGNPEGFAKELVSKMETYMKLLVSCGGARTFMINNIGPIGCIPDKSINWSRICNETLNEAVKAYNLKLVEVLKKFQNDFNVSIFLADSDRMFTVMVDHPLQFGFKNITYPCCGDWNINQRKFDCGSQTQFCSNRDEYLFFDGAHLTQKANEAFVDNCIAGRVCYPIHSL
ncbi:GDSL esterase/lipase At2g03980-like [Rhododendron vialii]|uniref:GDSL esterase/lipase At2g03980-like n=1 Tax=Rhododendron vialii TaxID=182163 RepID=UPI00265E8008|nr:GDSL esterase/lipase At2g03980-like [Rhododendron vialii]